jgi:aldehyde dehydrogenase (NAD+)
MVLISNPLVREYDLYIDGRTVPPSGGTYEKLNPATEERLSAAPDGTVEDMQQAIAAARRAFDDGPWPRMSGRERARYLNHIADLLDRRRNDLIELVIEETGCGRAMAESFQVGWPIDSLRTWAEYAALPDQEPLPPLELGPPGRTQISNRAVRYEPVGVVGAITAYNFPFYINISKIGPALAAGNTLVLKPSPLTPYSALCLPGLIEDADLPPGVVNIVNGRSAALGQALVESPDVDLISFTGSAAVGRAIAASAGATLKKVVLELGGKSALIALDDADPADVVARGIGAICAHAGQGCAITSRVLAPRALYPAIVEGMAAAAARLPVGPPRDPASVITPLISAEQRARVEDFIQSGIADGATLLHGGKRPAHLTKGYYLEPTVFSDVRNTMRIAREEIFGPVQTILPYDGGDEAAIALANDSPYGLSGAVVSASVSRALGVARRIRTGSIVVNNAMYKAPDAPSGGYKQSGLGREFGIWGFREYQEIKSIAWP